MFNPTAHVIDSFVDTLRENYGRVYGLLDPEYGNVVRFVGRIALETISNSDAAYHDVNHTIMVTQVGQEILKGKQLLDGGVNTSDWLHFVISLLCHDIGYVRGILHADHENEYAIDLDGGYIQIDHGATDAALTPYHVERSQMFVRERFGQNPMVDADVICANIRHTTFPVPDDDEYKETASYPALLRAADLIGQLADINYERKQTALFHEFQETGANDRLGYTNPGELRQGYPKFFWTAVQPYIADALRYLSASQEGKQWIANLYAHVFAQEHGVMGLGALAHE